MHSLSPMTQLSASSECHQAPFVCSETLYADARCSLLMTKSGWSAEETRSLISVWRLDNVQSQHDAVSRNCLIYERIAWDMESL